MTTKFLTVQSQRTNKFPIGYIVRIPPPPLFERGGGLIVDFLKFDNKSGDEIFSSRKGGVGLKGGLLRKRGFFTFILNFHKKEKCQNGFQFG